MPLGAFRLNGLGKFRVTAVAEVIRKKIGISAVGNAQMDTAQSKFGGASALFDGTGDSLKVNDANTFNFADGDNFTIEAWVRRASGGAAFQHIFSNNWNSSTTSTRGWTFLINSDGKLAFFWNSGSGSDFNFAGASTLSTGVWYHVAFTYNGSGNGEIFLNGTSDGSSTTINLNELASGDFPSIGSTATSTTGGNYSGHIDELRVSNIIRYTANFTAPTAPFVNDEDTLLLLHMDGTDASTVFTDDNGVRAPIGIAALGNAQVDTAQSKFGGASALFDGNNDHLSISSLPTITGDCTVELWGRFDILPWTQTLGGGSYMMVYTRGSTDYWMINRSGTGSQVNFQIATNNRYGSFTKSGVNLATNTWYHLAIVRNGGVWKAFFNGTELTQFINDSNFTNSGRTENIAFSIIGKFTDTRGSWDGYMDEFRVSNSARYTGDFTPSTTPFQNDANTVLLLHMDGTDASTVFTDDNGVRAPIGIAALGNAQVDTAQSKFGGGSALFDGTTDYLRIDNTAPLAYGTGNFTIEFWIRFNSTTAKVIWDQRASGQNGNYATIYWSSSTIRYLQGSTDRITSGTLSTATWYHVAISRSGTSTKMFINGTQAGSTFTDSTNYITGTPVVIGADSNNLGVTALDGWIDEVRVSNTARYTANFTEPSAPFQNDDNTLLLLHMDGTDASTTFIDDNGVIPGE